VVLEPAEWGVRVGSAKEGDEGGDEEEAGGEDHGEEEALVLSAGADMTLRAWSVRPPVPAPDGGADDAASGTRRSRGACIRPLARAASSVADTGGAAPLPGGRGGAAGDGREALVFGVGVEVWLARGLGG
jgi:hypothetical protein